MAAILSSARSDRHVAAGCAALALAAGWAVVAYPMTLFVVLAAMAVLVAIATAPLRWIGSALVFGLLTGPVLNVRGLLIADLALVAAIAVVLVRAPRAAVHARYAPWLVFVAWSCLITGVDPALVPLLHTFAPLFGGYLVARTASPETVWSAVRWCATASILTAPLFTDDITRRWSSLAGGPNELGLLAAALVVLSVADPKPRGRRAQLLIGFLGLTVTTSVSAGIAAIVGVLLLQSGVRSRLRRVFVARTLLKFSLVVGVFAILALRPDLPTTLIVHRDQAAATLGVLAATDPIVGGGWLHGADFIATGSLNTAYSSVLYDTVHNLYLQLLTDTGLIGLTLFLAALFSAWRRVDRTNHALLAMCAIWLNTTAAYPSVVWGLLGLVIAVPSSSTRCESRE